MFMVSVLYLQLVALPRSSQKLTNCQLFVFAAVCCLHVSLFLHSKKQFELIYWITCHIVLQLRH